MSTKAVVLYQGAIDAFGRSREVLDGLEPLGERVAERAAAAAPKDSGAGAASIHAEVDMTSASVRVGWDQAHDYMLFHEVGTSKMPARPFLRPALDGKYTL